MAQSQKKEVAVKGGDQLPAEYQYEGMDGAGFENHDRSDYSIPFLAVLQGLSPEIETVEGAKPGKIYNKVTGALYEGKDGVSFIPCYTNHQYVEWVPRDSGGGFVGVYELDSEIVAAAKRNASENGKIKLENGNDLVETFYVFGLILEEDGTTSQAVLAFTSTKIKKYKQWMTKARTIQIKLPNGNKITPPLFAHAYNLKTIKEKNTKGEFYNWDISFAGETAQDCRLGTDDPVFQEAVTFMGLVKAGAAKADYSTETGAEPDAGAETETEGKSSAGAAAGKGGKKRPF